MGAFSSSEDFDEDGELDERCCLLFFGNYDPAEHMEWPGNSLQNTKAMREEVQEEEIMAMLAAAKEKEKAKAETRARTEAEATTETEAETEIETAAKVEIDSKVEVDAEADAVAKAQVKVDEAKVAEAKVDEAKVEAKVDAAKVEAKVDEAKVDAAKVEAKVDEAKVNKAKVDGGAATTAASAATKDAPWAVVSAPVFKQYGKLAVRLGATVAGLQPSGQFLSLNDDANPLKFETPLFYGRMVVRVKDAPGAPPTTYFDGVRRKFSVQIEGRFTKKICANNIVMVSSYERKFVKLPPGIGVAVSQMRKAYKSCKLDLFSDAPCFTVPLLAMVDRIEVRQAGKPPGVPATVELVSSTKNNPIYKRLETVKTRIQKAMESGDNQKVQRLMKQSKSITKAIEKMEAKTGRSKADKEAQLERGMCTWKWGGKGGPRVVENSALLGGVGRKNPSDESERLEFFDQEKNRTLTFFKPDLVYSFDIVESTIDLNKFKYSYGLIRLDMYKLLNGQPLNIEARVLDDTGGVLGTLFRLEFLHEDLCPELLSELRS